MSCHNPWCNTPFLIKRMARPPTEKDGFDINLWEVADEEGGTKEIYMWTQKPVKHWVRYKRVNE